MIVLSPDAILDVERLRLFLETVHPDAASRAMGVIRGALERVQRFPEMGVRTGDPFIRQLVVRFGSSGYVVRYAALPNGDLLVTRIWHGRERRE